MLLVLASDFMIRGYDDPNLAMIRQEDLYYYQLLTLAVMIGAGFVTALIRKPYETSATTRLNLLGNPGARTIQFILAAGIFILFLELTKRLSSTGWSPSEVISQMLGPRGMRDWDVDSEIGRHNAVFQLISGMMPLAGVCFAYALFWGRFGSKILSAAAYLICVAILITDGSRTQCFIAFFAVVLFAMNRLKSVIYKASIIAVVLFSLVFLNSIMVTNRGGGYSDISSSKDLSLVYHQDDSIYRIWVSCAFADHSSYSWDPTTFFASVAASPVPRALWPSKPTLDEDFYGGYKLYYVTTTYIGEWVAIGGVLFGMIFAFLFSLVIYRLFYTSQLLISRPMGLVAYLLISLYIYMIFRSMPNLTMFIYAPAAGVALTLVASWIGKGGSRYIRLSTPR